MNVEEIRKLFPVTQNYVFLNNAAESPLNERFRWRMEEYLSIASESPQDKPSKVREEVRMLLSRLLGGKPEEYAMVTSTGVGIGIVASGFMWNEGDNIVVPADEHWNNTFPWLALRERGIDVRIAPVDENNRIKIEDMEVLVDSKTRIVAAAAVRFNSGFRSDLKKLSSISHKAGALFLVDGIQAAGVMPLNIEEDGIDILCCGGFKWLLGMPGTGFLYVKSEAQAMIRPIIPGMFAAENIFTDLNYYMDARRFETGSIAYSLFHGWTAGLELLLELGIENIYLRVMKLTDILIEGIKLKEYKILSPIEKKSERSSVIVFSIGDDVANRELYKRLKSKNIIITLREGNLRVSPSFFNTEEEIDAFLREI